MLQHLDADTIDFEIVFTTAYNQYALTAFEMNAIDYLLKPLRPNKVIEVIKKVQASKSKEQISTRLEELKESLVGRKFNKIGLPVSDGILFVPLEDIVHLEAGGMYTNFYTSNGEKLVVSKPLKYFDFLVEAESIFYRPHRSHIFNLHFLKQYVKKGGNYLLLENEHIVPVSKEKRDELLEIISSL
jgi:two-component system LytT family response regulator